MKHSRLLSFLFFYLGDENKAENLIRTGRGRNVDARNQFQMTPLYLAATANTF